MFFNRKPNPIKNGVALARIKVPYYTRKGKCISQLNKMQSKTITHYGTVVLKESFSFMIGQFIETKQDVRKGINHKIRPGYFCMFMEIPVAKKFSNKLSKKGWDISITDLTSELKSEYAEKFNAEVQEKMVQLCMEEHNFKDEKCGHCERYVQLNPKGECKNCGYPVVSNKFNIPKMVQMSVAGKKVKEPIKRKAA